MQSYILVIDTEATGLPKKWNKPFDEDNNWPRAIQISWLLYNQNGLKIKEENHYISNNDFTIEDSAYAIHGLDKPFLQKNGKDRMVIMQKLSSDLEEYKPLVVGHFMELDFLVIGYEFFKLNMPNPLLHLKTFCTMLGSKMLAENTPNKYLQLGKLYELLFNKSLENQHNALVDASATANCFFELLNKRLINVNSIEQQPQIQIPQAVALKKPKNKLKLALFVALTFTFVFLIWKIDYPLFHK